MKNLLTLVGGIFIFTSCTDSYESDKTNDLSPILLRAEVVQSSRTITDENGLSSFAEGDCIGLFIPGTEYAGEWSYDGYVWSTGSNPTWENREDDFEFCAFYPCSSGDITRESVTMPDLTSQTGKLSDIGEKDFLVARCVTSYSDNDGVVSFTGSNSFEHVYSLLHVSIVTQDDNDVLITGCRFVGDGIVEKREYMFGSGAAEDETVSVGSSEGSTLEIDYNPSVSVSGGLDVVVMINPLPDGTYLDFSLFYEKDGNPYVAEVTLPGEFYKGNYNKIKLSWVKEGLIIQNNEIKDWNVITTDDILFQGAEL